jgi:hypothetical protein
MFATRNLSEAVATDIFVDSGDIAYGLSAIDSSTRGIKQIVLWMTYLLTRWSGWYKTATCIARQDKGGSMAL